MLSSVFWKLSQNAISISNLCLDYNNPVTNPVTSSVSNLKPLLPLTIQANNLRIRVETLLNAERLRNIFLQLTKGSNGILDSDFDYTKIQFAYPTLFVGGLSNYEHL